MVLKCLAAAVSFLTLASFSVDAQTIEPAVLNASGGSVVSGGQVFEYSVGQLISSSIQAPHTPGVHQPAWAVTGIDRAAVATMPVQVFPDPMESVLFVQPEWKGPGELYCRLLDASGKLVLRQDARLLQGRERQSIDVSRLAAGNYVLEVTGIQGKSSPAKASFKLQKLR